MPPSGLAATALSQRQVELRWNDNGTAEAGFAVERAEGGSGFALLGTTGPGATSLLDDTAQPEQSYAYRVRAFHANGVSDYTNTASVTTPPDPPAAARPARTAR